MPPGDISTWEAALRPLEQHEIHVVGQRSTDFLALVRLVSVASSFACEGGADAHQLAHATGVPLFSPEAKERVRRRWSNEDLGSLTPGPDHDLTGMVVLYAASVEWETWARKNGVRLLCCSSSLKLRLDDKAAIRKIFAEIGIDAPRSVTAPRPAVLSGQVSSLGWPLVVQARNGASGDATRVVRGPGDLAAAVAALGGDELLVSSHIPGAVLNIHGVIAPSGVTLAPPSLQLAGIRGLAISEADYCGNDFTASAFHASGAGAAALATRRIADWLAQQGYRGAFGVDFVLDGDKPLALEINPRLQGSTFVLGEAELRERRFPTIARHLLALLGIDCMAPAPSSATLAGAHLVFRQSTPFDGESAARPGAYRVGLDGSVLYNGVRPGLLECADDEVLVYGVPPTDVAAIEPGAVVLRLATWRPVATSTGRLNDWGRVLRRLAITRRFAAV